MRSKVLQIPEHLRDALTRVDSANVAPSEASGLVVCGMGGSAIGGDLAVGALGDRLTGPVYTHRGYSLPSWVTNDWTVICSSYSGDTEETVAAYEHALEIGARRIVATTGGRLGELAEDAGDPIIRLPEIFTQPRTAVGYMLVSALGAAASARVAPRLDAEIDGAAEWLERQVDELQSLAVEIAAEITAGGVDRTPVVFGADLTIPVARRWKGQLNENAKLHAFNAEIPESCHNESVPWGTPGASDRFHAILLVDSDQHERERLRSELLASLITDWGGSARVVETQGASRTARLVWSVMLGDFVSLEVAAARGVDPEPIPPIDRLKKQLAG